MRWFYILLLFQLVFTGKLAGQTQFNQQHEKFIHLHRSVNPDSLLILLKSREKQLTGKQLRDQYRYKAELVLDRGIYFYMIDDYPQAIAEFEKAEKLKGLKLNRDQILLYTYLGVSYRNGLADFKKSDESFDKAIERAEKEPDIDLLASVIIKKTHNYYYQNQFKKGIALVESFYHKTRKDLTTERKISFCNLLAQGYSRMGVYDKYYANCIAGIELAKKTNDDIILSDQYYNFTSYFLNKQRYGEAKEVLIKSIDLLKGKSGVEARLYTNYSVLGQIYSSLNQPDSALYFAKLAHAYALKTGDDESLSVSYATLGNIYSEQEDYAKALNYFLQSAAIEERINGVNNIVDIYHNVGLAYLKMDKYQQSIHYLNKSNHQAYYEGDIYSLYLNYEDLAKGYYGLGNYKQAITMYDSAFIYYDSLNNSEKNKELLHLETRYKTKFKEQENKLLKQEVGRQNELAEKERKAHSVTRLLSIIFILLLAGVVYLLFIKYQLKKSKIAEANAKIQNQQLEEQLLIQRLNILKEEINRKNKLIQTLESGANQYTEENLINKITLENDWLAFMAEFDRLHNGYLTDLKSRFPSLSSNNLRLAALVKLELANKEIASILCITENGVKKAKQRLKEKTNP